MKLITLLLITAILQVSASTFAQKITLSEKRVPIQKVFDQIRVQTSYDFVFSDETLKDIEPVSIQVKDADLKSVLSKIFEGQPLDYSIEDKSIVVSKKEPSLLDKIKIVLQVPITVSGKVTDTTGTPLVGATIINKSGGKAILTNDKGGFTITGQSGDQVVISFIGYQPYTFTITNNLAYQNIVLHVSFNNLKEVLINKGYYSEKQELSTGNVSTVSGQDISKQPVSNPLAALEGRVPGLIVTQSSGVVGSGFKVQLRGQGSLLQGTDPLFVIDGVPFSPGNSPLNSVANAAGSGGSSGISPLYTINPADIESIEVLKDADATSIYGSRGANGVVLITTKKGQAGKTKFNANVYTGFSRITRTMDMLNTEQYIEMRKEGFKNDGVTPTNDNAPDLILWDNNRYTDFKKLLIGGTAHTTDGQLSLSGGNTNTQFMFGGGYHSETTVFPGSNSNSRASAHFSLNHQSTDKKFVMGLSITYSNNQSNLTGVDLTAYINTPPNLLLYDKNGNLNWQEGGVYYTGLITNPLAMTYNKYSGTYQNLNSNFNLSYKIIDGLKVKSSMGYNNVTTDEQSLNPSNSINPGSGTLPYANFGRTAQSSWIIEPQIEYVKKLGGGKVDLLIGSTFQDISANNITVQAQNYNSDLLLGSIAAAGNSTSSNANSQYRYTAFYGRLNYNWKEKYIINLTGRRDGSSRFGPGKQFANFGAIGTAWIFSEEAFIKDNLPFLSFGKLRGSYGTTGNDQIGNYKYLNTWSSTTLGYQGVAGLQPSSLYNSDFAWESKRKAEVAIELGVLNNRILLSAAYFNDRSSNQLISYKLPTQTGFGSILRNLDAVIENSGIEITASTKNIATKNFSWNTYFNLTAPQNKLIAFPGLETSTYSNTYILGQPLSAKRVFQYLGVDSQSGIYKFTDVNNDGVYDNADRMLIENTQPKFYGGMQNSFNYKGFQVDIFFEFKKQIGYNYLYTQSLYIPGYYYINQPTIVLQRWQKPGDVADIQKFTATGVSSVFAAGYSNLGNSEAVYSDASYIRLKNVALSYSFPTALSKRMHLDGLRLYVQGQNLFTITNYIGADPENQNLFTLPPLRTFTAGIQFTL